MVKLAVAFTLGVSILTVFVELPHWYWIFSIIPAVLIGLKYPRSIFVMSLWAGFLWALLHAYFKVLPELDESLEGVDLQVSGKISSIPVVQARNVRFEFLIHRSEIVSNGQLVSLPKKVRLNWYGRVPEMQLGETWNLRVRLKRPWGFANPGGFDYEKWLFEQGIRATGYVRNKGINERVRETSILNPTYYVRTVLNKKLSKIQEENSSVLKALVLGERGQIDTQRWQVLSQTGTNHLLAISGLHVGIVSGFAYFIMLFLWKRKEELCLRVAAHRIAALIAILIAIFYAMLAGFSIPTQRAMIMATVVFLSIYSMQSIRVWNILSIALMCVLVIDPFSVLSPGFWLSFVAVAIILFTIKSKSTKYVKWVGMIRMQLILSLGLFPLTLLFFQQASIISPVANIFAIPWISFLVVPMSLIGSLFLLLNETLGNWLLGIADHLLEIFWVVLEFLHSLPFATWYHAVPNWTIIPACVGILLLLSPKGFPGKILSIALLSPLLFAQQTKTHENELRVNVLDVGQGLAVVLEAGDKVLLYDTGPKFSNSFNAGGAVIVPYLRQRGIRQIDTLVVSHGDSDHSGGLSGVLSNLQVEHLISSNIEDYKHPKKDLCNSELEWYWRSVRFKFLHPTNELIEKGRLSSNNSSCVLLVEHSAGKILLTGDIEKSVERKLIKKQTNSLDIDVLIAPHHGSNSSSTKAFIEATSPDYVVFAAGYRNPYGFPDEKVISRYKEFCSDLVNTATRGMITFTFSDKNGLQLLPEYREVRQRFWHSNNEAIKTFK